MTRSSAVKRGSLLDLLISDGALEPDDVVTENARLFTTKVSTHEVNDLEFRHTARDIGYESIKEQKN